MAEAQRLLCVRHDAPIDTNSRCQRASRPVPFDHQAALWVAVREGVVFSTDVNKRFEIVYETSQRKRCEQERFQRPADVQETISGAGPALQCSPPMLLLPPTSHFALPYQRQPPAVPLPPLGSGGGGPPKRTPLGEIDLNVLKGEVAALETENALLKRRVALQDNLIHGFCKFVSLPN